MTTFRSVILLPAALVLTIGLAGCNGGGGPAAPDVDPDTPPPATTPGVPPEGGESARVESSPAPAGLE